MEYEESLSIEWGNGAEFSDGIRSLSEYIKLHKLTHISVAAYGPFKDLAKGILHKNAHKPLQDIDLKAEFLKTLNQNHRITFYTDAAACALGESVERNTSAKEILGFILVTDGVGLGVVQGRNVLPTALHPEIGLISLRLHKDEPLIPEEDFSLREIHEEERDFQYTGSLDQLAANKSFRVRFNSRKSSQDKCHEMRSFYLAQACLSFTAIQPPHHIVITGDNNPGDTLGSSVNEKFKKYIQARDEDRQPLFQYKALESPNFISSPIVGGNYRPLGALGMCYAAARKAHE